MVNGLVLNAGKSWAIIIGSKDVSEEAPPILLNGTVIPDSKTVKDLGLVLDTWSEHADDIFRKVTSGLHKLWPVASVTPKSTRLMLAKSLLMPYFSYCSSIFSYGLSNASIELLKKAIKSAIRYVYGLLRRRVFLVILLKTSSE